MTRMAAMARRWIEPSSSPTPRKAVHRHRRSGVMESLNILLALLVSVIAPALATVTGPPHFTTEKGPDRSIAKDETPAGFPYALGSFNGLLIDHGEDEMGETPRLDLVSRAPKDATVEPLKNNKFEAHEISMGAAQRWSFSVNSAASNGANNARNDQNKNTKVYISVTICRQPIPKESISDTGQGPDPLVVHVSEKDNKQRKPESFAEGHMSTTLHTKSDVYIDIEAPKSSDFIGSYSYQVAVSTDNFFHKFNDQVALLSDTGSTTALLYYAEEIANINTANYTVFTINADKADLSGLSQSYCALERAGKIANVETSPTKTREQFSITGLNRSSNYMGVLATSNTTNFGNGIVGGGGTVWKAEPFKTKANGNCEIIHKLGFCSDTAQAVPYNPSMSLSEAGKKYDDNAEKLYRNFTYSLQQIQCNTTSETNFSMAVNCSGCADAYKAWLCAVTIPECDDYNASNYEPNNGSLIRNIKQPFPNGTHITEAFNTSLIKGPRNGFIDETIKPGPYSEKLPNLTFCHNLVRQCPMALGFSCPDGNRAKYSYNVSTGLSLQVPYPLWSTMMASSIVGTMLWPF